MYLMNLMNKKCMTRADLSMMRHDLVGKLNGHVGAQIITDIRFG